MRTKEESSSSSLFQTRCLAKFNGAIVATNVFSKDIKGVVKYNIFEYDTFFS